MKAPAAILLVVSMTLFGGCAGKDYDPRQGGLFGGVAGLGSGSYENRVKERQASLEELRATRDRIHDETSRLEAGASAARVQLQEDQERVRAMQADIAQLEKKVNELTTTHGADEKRVDALRKRTADLKKQMEKQSFTLDALEGSGMEDTEMELRRKQLEQQRNSLRREYELLLKMQLEMSR